jgi:membrane protease YdiL (CAAX protease family)
MSRQGCYFLDTRHPVPCLLFLLPLLIAYEVGILWVGGGHPEALRSGVDAWLRWVLLKFGIRQLVVLPLVIALVFIVWGWLRRKDRPADLAGSLLGMTLESVAFALVLYGICACLNPVLFGEGEEPSAEAVAVPAAAALTPAPPVRTPGEQAAAPEGLQEVVTFVGAGIYEEVVFRLVLFTAVFALLRLVQAPLLLAGLAAGVVSAACFAAVHHLGPFGEPFESGVFVFRLLAGLYFAFLFHVRGFGIAVGAHACYDILAGFSSNL